MSQSTTTKARGRPFPPGQSGNIKGRPPGAGRIAKLREDIAADLPEIIAALTSAAKSGDVGAARVLVERVLPAVKPVELAVPVALPAAGSLTEQGRTVLAAVAAGELAPAQGAALLGAIGQLARIAEVDELAQRIAALEARQAAGELQA